MTQNRKNLLSLLVALGCIILAVSVFQLFFYKEVPAPPATIEELDPEKVRESIVRIESESDPPRYGTGFFVAPDKIATNIHVVAQSGPIVAKKIHIEKQKVSIDEKGSTWSEQNVEKETVWRIEGVTAFDIKNDLAILKVAVEGVPLPIGNSNDVKIDEEITITAYPAPSTFMGIRSKSYKVEKGKIYSVRKSDKWLRTEVNLGGGSSGSPVLNSKGEVIGIHTSGNYTFGYSLAIPSKVLKKLLTKSKTVEPLVEWQKRELIRAYAYFVQGKINFDLGLYEDAIAALDKAIQLDSKSIYAYAKRGSAKFSIGMSETRFGNTQKAQRFYEDAVRDYSRAIKINPKNASAFTQRAQAKFELGDRKGALVDYNKAIKINYRYEQAYFLKAIYKSEQGDFESKQGNAEMVQRLYEESIEYYTYAIKHAPKSFYYHMERAEVKSKLGKFIVDHGDVAEARLHYQGAIEDFDKVLQINPRDANTYYKRGLAKEALGRKEEAKADFSKAKELDPNVGK